jgi:hypothetical protein
MGKFIIGLVGSRREVVGSRFLLDVSYTKDEKHFLGFLVGADDFGPYSRAPWIAREMLELG